MPKCKDCGTLYEPQSRHACQFFDEIEQKDRVIATWPDDLAQDFKQWENQFWTKNNDSKFTPLGQRFVYIDRFRVARLDSDDEMRTYEKVRKDGCCGFYDEEFELKSGVKFKYGFNHGH